MRDLQTDTTEELLVGPSTGDDAAVWKLDEGRALVSTADFITPVVDDARTWGRVAAANSVSDIYAMGAKPMFALNLVGWNTEALPTSLLGEVLAGGQDVATAGGFAIVGGHTIDDPEPKYGMSVTGEVDPKRILTNTGLKPGQELILTKPLGVGVITTAIKADKAADDIAAGAVDSMVRLNDTASSVALAAGATGCTDVTGFGLLGHLGRMAIESKVAVSVAFESVPFLEGAVGLANEGVMPGGSRRNLSWGAELFEPGSHPETHQLLISDAQTSGGLVFGVDPGESANVVQELEETGHRAAVVGTVTEGNPRFQLL